MFLAYISICVLIIFFRIIAVIILIFTLLLTTRVLALVMTVLRLIASPLELMTIGVFVVHALVSNMSYLEVDETIVMAINGE